MRLALHYRPSASASGCSYATKTSGAIVHVDVHPHWSPKSRHRDAGFAIESLPDNFFTTLHPHEANASREEIEADIASHFLPKPREIMRDVVVDWETFCIPCFGFSNELMHFAKPLEGRIYLGLGNGPECFCPGTPRSFQESLQRLSETRLMMTKWLFQRETHSPAGYRGLRPQRGFHNASVAPWSDSGSVPNVVRVHISHKDPGSFPHFSASMRPDVVIGRAMYEFNKVPSNWLSHKDDVDEIWVPCRFVRWVFEKAGFPRDRLFIVPEPIDVFYYDPYAATKIRLPLPPETPWRRSSNIAIFGESVNANADEQTQSSRWRSIRRKSAEVSFKFLSVFKWEDRKGWEILLDAYFDEFRAEEPVSLYLLSYVYGNQGRDPESIIAKIRSFIDSRNAARGCGDVNNDTRRCVHWPNVPHVEVISEQLDEDVMVSMYASTNCFVLPTKGEGWGLPVIQAMSMGMPTIATNWSGIQDIADDSNSFLIPVDRLEPLPYGTAYGWDKGKFWAVPSARELRRQMRFVVDHREEAKARGEKARRDVVSQFSDEVIAEVVQRRIEELVTKAKQKAAHRPWDGGMHLIVA
jgi:glycosyltransferase involved in cell wall biosynthesis